MKQTVTKIERPTFKLQAKILFGVAGFIGMLLPLISWRYFSEWNYYEMIIPTKFILLEFVAIAVLTLFACSIFLLKRKRFTLEGVLGWALIVFTFSWCLNGYLVCAYLRTVC